MATSWIKARQTRYGAFAALYIIVILAIVGAANYLASRNNKTVDFTANKRFTLADQTIKVVTGLKKPVNVYYFDRSDRYDRARDTFDRYANLSSNFKVQYVDPDKKPDLARVEGVHNFGETVVDSGEKKEVAKSVTEEELTGALIRSLKTGLRMACFVNGSGEHRIDDPEREGYTAFKEALEKNNFKTDTISLIQKPEVPKTCTVVVIAGPKRDYLDPAIDAIRTFVKGGGKVIMNLDPVLTLPDDKMGDTPKLAALAAEWGITAKGDFLLDLGAASRMFGQQSPVVGKYESHPIVRVMQDNLSAFPLTRSLEVKAPAESLFSSTEDSFSLVNPKLPIPESALDKAPKGPFIMGAAASIGTGETQGRVVVVGSSNWLDNNILAAPIANRDLVMNMFNWLTSDEDLISIRPKDPDDRRMNTSGSSLRVLFLVSVVFLPLFAILSGVSVWWRRR